MTDFPGDTPPPRAAVDQPHVGPSPSAPRRGRDAPLDGRQVVVVGLMGSGKTTVASFLAARLGRPLRDSDTDLRARLGRTAGRLAAEQGRGRLHAWEASHLIEALAGESCVIAAAASTIEDVSCRAALAQAVVVWLDVDPRVLVERHGTGGHRPVYDTDLLRSLRDMDARRRRSYERVADVIVRVGVPPLPREVLLERVLAGLDDLAPAP